MVMQILAIAYLSVGVGFILSGDQYRKAMKSLMADDGAMFLGGAMSIVIGGILVSTHNNWVSDWTVIVTIFGWLALIKGIALLAFPTSFSMFKPLVTSQGFAKVMGPGALIAGIIFAYLGFFA